MGSLKDLMQTYEVAAGIVHAVRQRDTSVKAAVYADTLVKNKRMLLRLCCEVLFHWETLSRIADDTGLAKHTVFTAGDKPGLFSVLLYERLFGDRRAQQRLKRVPRALKVALAAKAGQLDAERAQLDSEGKTTDNRAHAVMSEPVRYVRVNTLLTTVEDVLADLAGAQYEEVAVQSQYDLTQRISDFAPQQFARDPFVPNLLVFPPTSPSLHNWSLVESGHVLLQDKSSCLATLALDPQPGCHVLETCAAPGMKTTHLAALMGNKGRLICYDRSAPRLETMERILEKAGVSCAKTICDDFLQADVNAKEFRKVHYALVDPPCSGSGITRRLSHVTDKSETKDKGRLKSLANVQAMLLRHTLSLPNVRRVVYSTCSVNYEENEAVIGEILRNEQINSRFELEHVLPSWTRRGQGEEFKACVRTDVKKDKCNGFFVACFVAR